MRLLLFLILLPGIGRVQAKDIVCGADQPSRYLSILKGKNIGLVVNQTSRVGELHLLDFLLDHQVIVAKVFSPEHGFRGDADAGEIVDDELDSRTGLPVVSLYGANRKPEAEQLQGIDLMIFDIQDVGVRFYTYLSTLHLVMEACAENKIPLLLLDRPNPNGDYIAGPVLEEEFKSFVGMHPIPIVHGCTLGEMARMINGEGWLGDTLTCDLTVIPVKNYSHKMCYSLPVKPSPNLPNDLSIRLYPSLCFFEATNVSIGRGTFFPFQVIGYPDSTFGNFSFVPESIPGMAKSPKQEGQVCFGEDLRCLSLDHEFTLAHFLDYYRRFGNEKDFISSQGWFNLLAGTDSVLKQIRDGATWRQIEYSWEVDLNQYKAMRRKYLIYPD